MSSLAQAWYGLIKIITRASFRIFFRLQTEGADRFPLDGPVILASNHQSYLDPILLGIAAPRQLRFLARESLLSVLFGG